MESNLNKIFTIYSELGLTTPNTATEVNSHTHIPSTERSLLKSDIREEEEDEDNEEEKEQL